MQCGPAEQLAHPYSDFLDGHKGHGWQEKDANITFKSCLLGAACLAAHRLVSSLPVGRFIISAVRNTWGQRSLHFCYVFLLKENFPELVKTI
jgi:hypothetical protein